MRIVRANVVMLLFACLCAAQSPAPAARASAAMVTIRGVAGNGKTVSGSGFLVAPNGTIVTTVNLVKDLTHPQITLSTGDIFDSFTLVSSDARRGIAIIRIAGFDLPSVQLGNSNSVQPGDLVVVVSGAKEEEWSATVRGIANAEGSRLIELSANADVSPGELLLNSRGEAIGMIDGATASNATAVPINYARGLLDAPVPAVQPAAPAVVAATPEQTAPPVVSKPQAPLSREPEASVATAAPTQPAVLPAPAVAPPAPVESAITAPRQEKPSQSAPVQTAEATAPASQPAPAAQPAPAPIGRENPAPELARGANVRKIYIESLGQGEGPDMLRDKIVHNLKELNFVIVDTPGEADAILSGSGKWDHVRVQHFRARLVAGDARELWSGDVSTGGWIRSASSSVANKLVEDIARALALAAEMHMQR